MLRNTQIAQVLRRYAAMLTYQGENPFKTRAYLRAADSLESLGEDVVMMIQNGADLTRIPGVGKGLSGVLQEIVATGKLASLEDAIAELPPRELELIERPALDPKRVLRIYRKLGIRSLRELKEHSDSGELERVFGPRLGQHVRMGLDDRKQMLLWAADKLAGQIEEWLGKESGVSKYERTGSLRRRKDTVEQLDLLFQGRNPTAVWDRFSTFGPVQSAEPRQGNSRTFILSLGRHVRLIWSSAKRWGTALVEETGTPSHLAQLLSAADADLPEVTSERALYRRLALPLIEPELREGRGEVKAARQKALPRLIARKDLRGDLHMHTTASDGSNTLAEMADAARALGYEYIAITDHSQSLKIAQGLSEERLQQQIQAIDRWNAEHPGFTIFKSAEVDILEDGQLDYSEDLLKQLDLTVCSIHSHFQLDRRKQTERILRAMDNPFFRILGHATGRMLLRRPGYDVDLERILKHARDLGRFCEINSNPNRLDLNDEWARRAKLLGVPIVINTDAHSIEELQFISAGIDQARRGWLESADVLNTLPLEALRTRLGSP